MTICNVACCEELAVSRSMCAAHDAHYHPSPHADETWRSMPYADRPTSGDPHALATHASRAQAVLDVFTGAAFAPRARRPAADPLRPVQAPPGYGWRPCEACLREIGQLPTPGWQRRVDLPDGRPAGPPPTEGENRECRDAVEAIRTRCLEAHAAAEPGEAA